MNVAERIKELNKPKKKTYDEQYAHFKRGKELAKSLASKPTSHLTKTILKINRENSLLNGLKKDIEEQIEIQNNKPNWDYTPVSTEVLEMNHSSNVIDESIRRTPTSYVIPDNHAFSDGLRKANMRIINKELKQAIANDIEVNRRNKSFKFKRELDKSKWHYTPVSTEVLEKKDYSSIKTKKYDTEFDRLIRLFDYTNLSLDDLIKHSPEEVKRKVKYGCFKKGSFGWDKKEEAKKIFEQYQAINGDEAISKLLDLSNKYKPLPSDNITRIINAGAGANNSVVGLDLERFKVFINKRVNEVYDSIIPYFSNVEKAFNLLKEGEDSKRVLVKAFNMMIDKAIKSRYETELTMKDLFAKKVFNSATTEDEITLNTYLLNEMLKETGGLSSEDVYKLISIPTIIYVDNGRKYKINILSKIDKRKAISIIYANNLIGQVSDEAGIMAYLLNTKEASNQLLLAAVNQATLVNGRPSDKRDLDRIYEQAKRVYSRLA